MQKKYIYTIVISVIIALLCGIMMYLIISKKTALQMPIEMPKSNGIVFGKEVEHKEINGVMTVRFIKTVPTLLYGSAYCGENDIQAKTYIADDTEEELEYQEGSHANILSFKDYVDFCNHYEIKQKYTNKQYNYLVYYKIEKSYNEIAYGNLVSVEQGRTDYILTGQRVTHDIDKNIITMYHSFKFINERSTTDVATRGIYIVVPTTYPVETEVLVNEEAVPAED